MATTRNNHYDLLVIGAGATGSTAANTALQQGARVALVERDIKVDGTLRTSVLHIWAAGNVTGGLQFTHVAYAQGKLAAQNAFSEHPRPFDDRVIPWVTFTFPSWRTWARPKSSCARRA